MLTRRFVGVVAGFAKYGQSCDVSATRIHTWAKKEVD